ncbi:nucleoside hydrolase [Blastopirellula sp. JC732]|uniref:Nucleoside hydrolase n=1 Tax=Blastopirellula sediminis TaxID=2894196 RepID=A0A9X1MN82_9BACT|nr:nucleoside hydrolase [Blastopirellula sediminis]MCC9608644.1 nucleoside hydrolase [Blastopirellula sediminis]MCC9628579.1 nucleoside hydrolase [Blastopirellula sediminis]
MKRLFISAVMCLFVPAVLAAEETHQPIPVIFDTDIGNDCDDVLALAMLHALESRGECKLLAVTITKDHELAAPFTDCVNTFYGRGDIPIGVCRSGVTPEAGKFNVLAAAEENGHFRFPHDLKSGKTAPDAVAILRKALVDAEDGSVVICQVGFSTNLANLIDSPADDISPLSGKELVEKKVRLLSVMAAAFTDIPDHKTGEPKRYREYNVFKDIPSARRLFSNWPTPILWSGFEIGLNLTYPYDSIVHDFDYVEHHPVAESYNLYITPPHNRPTWDLTSVLVAIRPEHRYFDLSPAGRVTIEEDGYSTFEPMENGRDRYLILRDDQKARATEALTLLSSEPPHNATSPSSDKR